MAQKPAKSSWNYDKNLLILSILSIALSRLEGNQDAANLLTFASCFGPGIMPVISLIQAHTVGPENTLARTPRSVQEKVT